MRTRLVLASIVLIIAGCGGGATSTQPNGQPASTRAGATTPVQPEGTPGTGGELDCAALVTAAQQLIAIQLLAQLSTPETVDAIRGGEIGNVNLDAFLGAMQKLHALDGRMTVFGDPKTAIDAYEKAARAAKDLFATEHPTQAAIDQFNQENIGTIGDFIGHQAAISAALGEAGC